MNCLDCLDRTNAVQSFIALEVCLSAIYILSWAAGGMGWALVVTVGRGQPCAWHLERGLAEGHVTGGPSPVRGGGGPHTLFGRTPDAAVHGHHLEERQAVVVVVDEGGVRLPEVRLGLQPAARVTSPGSLLGGGVGSALPAIQPWLSCLLGVSGEGWVV